MAFLRSQSALRTISRRSPIAIRQAIRPLSTSTPLRSTQGYGDMKGNPESEDPQNQGASSSAKHNAEHPGPAPPSEGKGTGAGPTKAGGSTGGQKDPADASAQSGGSRSKEAKETGSSPTGGKVGGGGKRQYSTSASSSDRGDGAVKEETVQRARDSEKSTPPSQPKIINDSDPSEGQSKEKQQEVEQHNKEFEERYDRAQPAKDNKVDDKFWKGE